MAIIRSFGTVQSLAAPTPTYVNAGSGTGGSGYGYSYATLYRTQPAVRTVVDFLARNIAQLGVHAYRRVSDTDRVRLPDHDTVQSLNRPNPYMTRYRLFESTMQDMGVYFNAFWLKVRTENPTTGQRRIGLVRIPTEQMQVEGGLFPSTYIWTLTNGERREFAPSEIVHFGGYDPCNPLTGLSPLETLRRVLLEEISASDYRQYYWKNFARHDGIIERDKEAKAWTPEQYNAWRTQWNAAYTGRENSGKTALLMPGMTWKDRTFSAKDSELTNARKLTREEVTRAYHVPLPMAGILDHATFSNITEQHKNLYQDALGPWTVMLEEELERQLLIESDDTDRVYLEFNIAEKLKGSFEEQAASLVAMAGGPIITRNEARARLNLSSLDDPAADELITPLNMTGGDLAPDDAAALPEKAAIVVSRHKARQQSRLEKIEPEDRPSAFNLTRWNKELADDLIAAGMPADRARLAANAINRETLAALTEAIEEEPSE
jgi:HK97 family phage portal protein